MRKYLLIFLLCAGSAGAGQVVISTFPNTISDADHTSAYNTGTDDMDTVSWVADSINVPGGVIVFDRTNDWFVNAWDKEIVCGTDSTILTTSLKRAIRWNAADYGDSNFVIHGGYWRHRPDNFYGDSAAGRSSYRPMRLPGDTMNDLWVTFSLYTDRLVGVIFDSIQYADCMGYMSNVISGDGERILIRACSLYCRSAGFGNRSNFNSNALFFDGVDTGSITRAVFGDSNYYNLKIEKSYIYSNGQTGLYFTGLGAAYNGGIVQIDSTTFVGDIRNYADTVGANEYWSTTNCYQVWLQQLEGSSRVHACSVLSDSNYKGARAMTLYSFTNDTGWITIDSNYMMSHDGFSTQYLTSSHSAVIKLRAAPQHIRMFGNELWLVVDTFDASNSGGWLYSGDTTAYLNSGSILTMQANTFNDPEHTVQNPEGTYTRPLPWYVKIYNNTGGVIYRSNNTTGEYRNTSIYAFDNQLMDDTTTEIYGNTWYYVNSYATYGHPGFDGSGAFCRVYYDTLHKVDTTVAGVTITNSSDTLIVMNPFGDSANGNILRDIYWASGGTTNIENQVTTIAYGGVNDDCQLGWERTLRLLVQSGERANLSGVIVSAVNAYGGLAFVDTTDANGLAGKPVRYNAQSSPDYGDSTGFGPFTLNFDIDGDGGAPDTSISMTVDWQVYSDTLVWGEATYIQKNILLNSGDIRGGVFK